MLLLQLLLKNFVFWRCFRGVEDGEDQGEWRYGGIGMLRFLFVCDNLVIVKKI